MLLLDSDLSRVIDCFIASSTRSKHLSKSFPSSCLTRHREIASSRPITSTRVYLFPLAIFLCPFRTQFAILSARRSRRSAFVEEDSRVSSLARYKSCSAPLAVSAQSSILNSRFVGVKEGVRGSGVENCDEGFGMLRAGPFDTGGKRSRLPAVSKWAVKKSDAGNSTNHGSTSAEPPVCKYRIPFAPSHGLDWIVRYRRRV